MAAVAIGVLKLHAVPCVGRIKEVSVGSNTRGKVPA